MATKRILLLDGRQLTAFHCGAGRIKVEGEFSQEPVGLEAFSAYLSKHRSSVFYLLADVAEEGFQLEELPYVQGSDRSALLKRRLSQYFYNTSLATTISLGRAPDGRRDEKILFIALTRMDTFSHWLDILRENESLLAGVYSVPLVLSGLAPKLLGESGPVLLVSQSSSGVRQTFFDNGKLQFSRLSQLATNNLDEIGRTSTNESEKIYQYLLAQRQIPRGTSLRATVLAHGDQMAVMQEFCRNTNDLQFEFLDIAATARKLGLKDAPRSGKADSLFIHGLVNNTPAQQFAPETETRFHNLWRIRVALYSVAWITLGACLVYAGKTGLSLYELRDRTDTTRSIAATDTHRYNGILDALPKISLSPDKLRAVIERFDELQKRTPEIEPLLLHLSEAMDSNPGIEISSLDWQFTDHLDTKNSPRTGNEKPSAIGAAKGPWVSIEIQAQLPLDLAGDQRAQIEMIENFAAGLRRADTNVSVLDRPFDIESNKAFKSSGQTGAALRLEAPKFALRIARLVKK